MTNRIGTLFGLASAILLGGCAALEPSPMVLKSQVEPVMRTAGAEVSADHLYQAGRNALAAGDLSGARRLFSQTLLRDPNYLDAINGMAAVLTVQGRYEDSLQLIRQALERAPGNEMFSRNVERVEALIARSGGEMSRPADGVASSMDGSEGSPQVPAPVVALQEPLTRLEPAVDLALNESKRNSGPTVVEVAPNVFLLQLPQDREAAPVAETVRPKLLVEAPKQPSRSRRAPPPASSAMERRALAAATRSRPSTEPAGRVIPAGSLATAAYTSGPSRLSASVMVTNGMGRTGWAAHHAELFGAMGMKASRITNYRHFGVEHTLIKYRDGWRGEAERILASVATVEGAKLVVDDGLPSGIDLQVILGRDSEPARPTAARS